MSPEYTGAIVEIDLDLRRLLKRGAWLAAANWPVLVIQVVAETTFQAVLAVPVIGAAVLIALLLGDDLSNLLQGDLRDMLTAVASTLSAEPVAFAAFLLAFGIVLIGGSVFMFLVKGGTVAVLLAANTMTGPVERGPLTLETLRLASRFTFSRFAAGCRAVFRRYTALGLILIAIYGVSGAAYVGVVYLGYQSALTHAALGEWTVVTAVATLLLIAWVTVVNFSYLLVQIVIAADDAGIVQACTSVARLARRHPRQLGGVFLLVLVMGVGATTASALAWSGLGLIAFIPLVGFAVVPLQVGALLARGFLFEYLGLTALAAYAALYAQGGEHAHGDAPVGGRWNYDAENRNAFPRSGPTGVPVPTGFAPDGITREVIALVNDRSEVADLDQQRIEEGAQPGRDVRVREAAICLARTQRKVILSLPLRDRLQIGRAHV